MSDAFSFDATQIDPSSTFETLPANWYRAHIVESEVKPTKRGTGKYLQLTWEVLDGEYRGRRVWDRLNIVNENATAQEIAERALSAICHATGVLRLASTAQLHHKPLLIKVSVKKDAEYGDQNVIKGYQSDSTPASKPAAATRPASATRAPLAAAPAARPIDAIAEDNDDLPF